MCASPELPAKVRAAATLGLLAGLVACWLLPACAGDATPRPADTGQADAALPDASDDATAEDAVDSDLSATDLREDPALSDLLDAPDGNLDAVPDVDLGDADASELPAYPQPTVEGWIYDVDDTFWANMDDFVFDVLQEHGVQLYLAVMNANFFEDPAFRSLGIELVRHPESFLENALAPLLERYGDSGVIWAIDCMNEPEAMIAGASGHWVDDWGVTWDEMRGYLGACADTVRLHSDLPVSAGSGWHDEENVAAGRYAGLGLDFFDYHYYSDDPNLSTVSALGVDLPVIIGECGQSSAFRDDALQLDVIRGVFGQAESRGYSAALSWYYDYPGSTNQHAHVLEDGTWRPVEDAYAELADSELWVGTNLAWFSKAYSHDMSINTFQRNWSVVYNHDLGASVIEDLEAHDIDLLRFWVFEGGEALYYHLFFEDFEGDVSRWKPFGEGVTLRRSALHLADGDASLAIYLDPDAAGWYGVDVPFATATPLNLHPATEWRYVVTNATDVAVGVNLAFVTRTDAGTTTYQTRSGADGGQVWLEPGESRPQVVSLTAEDFPAQWARDTAPEVGVARPPELELENVTEIRLRTYVSPGQLPLSGDLYVDAIRIR